MTFSDYLTEVLGKSFEQGFGSIELTTTKTVLALLFASLLSIYVFFCYRYIIRRTFYSKNFNISLAAISLITTAIILTIQSSLVVSLGMVGALSIVRFRTAIKEPMDLAFLFWSIAIGIMCGAGMLEVAILSSISITMIIFILDRIPVSRSSKILTLEVSNEEEAFNMEVITNILNSNCRVWKEKSRIYERGITSLVYEIRTSEDYKLCDMLNTVEGLVHLQIIEHDSEVTF